MTTSRNLPHTVPGLGILRYHSTLASWSNFACEALGQKALVMPLIATVVVGIKSASAYTEVDLQLMESADAAC